MHNDNDNDNDEHNNMIPAIWGPSMWLVLHSITFCYPNNPSDEIKQTHKSFFELLGDILPCIHCRDSYKKLIKNGLTKLDDNVLKNRQTLTTWLYNIHEAVNYKIGVDYGVCYSDVVEKYDSFKISCQKNNTNATCDIDTNNDIAYPFKMANQKDCPIIPYKIAKQFVTYAKEKGLSEDNFYLINNFQENVKNRDLWQQRNEECYSIIHNMRLNGILSIDAESGLPTIEELRLIVRLSSNLTSCQLSSIIKKLSDNSNYKLEFDKLYKIIV